MRSVFIFLGIVFLFVLVSASEQQDVFLLQLKYNNGTVTFEKLLVTKGYFALPVDQPEKGYLLEVLSFENKILYSQKFNFDFDNFAVPPPDDRVVLERFSSSSQEILQKRQAFIEFVFPYFADAAKIMVKDLEGKQVLSFEVNSDRQVHPTNAKERNTPGGLFWVIIFILAILVLMIIVFILYKRKRLNRSSL